MINRNKKLKNTQSTLIFHKVHHILTAWTVQAPEFILTGNLLCQALHQPWQGQRLLVTGRLTLQLELHSCVPVQRSPGTFPAPLLHLTSRQCPLNEVTRVSRTLIWPATAQQIRSKWSQWSVPMTVRFPSERALIKDCSFICCSNKPLQFGGFLSFIKYKG